MENNISTKEQVSKQETKDINGMEFVSISSEEYRTYLVSDESGNLFEVKIKNPQWLFVRPSKSHMVIDNNGLTYYIPSFISLAWKNKEGKEEAQF